MMGLKIEVEPMPFISTINESGDVQITTGALTFTPVGDS
jgi:hypothetical protein